MNEIEGFLDECRADPWFRNRAELLDRLEEGWDHSSVCWAGVFFIAFAGRRAQRAEVDRVRPCVSWHGCGRWDRRPAPLR